MAFGWVWFRLATSSWCPLAAYGPTLESCGSSNKGPAGEDSLGLALPSFLWPPLPSGVPSCLGGSSSISPRWFGDTPTHLFPF